jgi:hypothetical protein
VLSSFPTSILRLHTSGKCILARFRYLPIDEKVGSSVLAVHAHQVKVICHRVVDCVMMWVAPWLLDGK